MRRWVLALVMAVAGLAFAVAEGQSASAVSGGTISGTVSGAGVGPLAGAEVDLYNASSEYSYTIAYTDAQGNYSFGGVTPGTYKVRFKGGAGSPWFSEFWNDKATFALADPITVTSGGTATVNSTLARGPQIKGTVTNDAGQPVASAHVTIYKAESQNTFDYVVADANGKYATTALTAGSYKIYVSGTGLVSAYWNNKDFFSDADPVTVAATDVPVNPVLQRAGAITGKLTDPDGKAVSGWHVTATRQYLNGSWSYGATTKSDGTYSIESLPPADYTVQWTKPQSDTSEYGSQWYKAARSKATATSIPVEGGKTVTGIDAKLWKAGSISGKVTGPTGTGIAGVTVSAKLYSAQTYTATTAADGTYRIPAVEDGDYKVWFTGAAGSKWITEYYDDQPSFNDADTVTVDNSAALTGIDAQLTEGALLSGTLTASSGSLSSPWVSILTEQGYARSVAYPDQAGKWSAAVPAGTYKIQFNAYGDYLSEYYDDAADLSTAKAITVTPGESKTGLNAVLDKGASISGTVTVDKGTLGSAYVYAETPASSRIGYVASNGTYTISGLPAGTYTLRFSAEGYQQEYWDDKADFATADKITVTKGQVVTGKNAQLTRGAVLKGKVVDKNNVALQGIRVSVRPASNENAYPVTVTTAADGTYTVAGLAAGTYLADYSSGYFSNEKFVPSWYLNKSSSADADRITVAKNEEKTLSTVTLARYSSLNGTVRDKAGNTVSGVRIIAYRGQDSIATAWSDVSGKYTITGLNAGTYRLRMLPPGGSALAEQWWDGVPSIYGAKKLTLGADQALTQDLTMRSGASIAGTVTGPANQRVAGLTVRAVGPERVTATTAADGTYALTGLDPGKYAVSFSGSTNYFPQWYNGEPTKATSDKISVDFGDARTGIDAKLMDSPYVTGKITTSAGPAEGVEVRLYATNTGNYVASAITDATGTYRTRPVAPGKYDMHAMNNGDVLSQWYTAADVQSDATTLVVVKDKATVANMVMQKGARIQGKVTGPSGPVVGAWITVSSDDHWAQGYTDEQGRYTLGGLPAGDYTVHAWPSFGNLNLVGQYYNGKYDETSADKVSVAKGATASNIDFALTGGTSISGKITTADGRAGYYGVEAYRKTQAGMWESFTEQETDYDGNYTIRQLPPGDYKLVARGRGYKDQWWNGKSTVETANVITVGSTPITGRDFVLQLGPGIGGKITLADGQPFDRWDFDVIAYRFYEGDGYEYFDDFRVAEDGTFLASVPQGKYKIAVRDYSNTYARQYWNNKSSLATADAIDVAADRVTGKNFTLKRSRKVSGSVVFPAGVTSSVGVELIGADGSSSYDSVRPGAADFSFLAAPGTYKLRFTGQDVMTEWWQDKETAEAATPIVVSAEADVTGLVAVLNQGAKISGTVTDTANRPVSASVWILDADTGERVDGARTDPDGHYSVGSLPMGRYVVKFDADGTDYAPQWFSGAATRSSASEITLAGNGAATADAKLVSGAILTGKVTDHANSDLAGAAVTIESAEGREIAHVTTNTRGVYTVLGLDEGSFKVHVQPPTSRLDLLGEWYDNAATSGSAKPVDVFAAKTVKVNVGLDQGATISGTVKGPGGKVAKGIGVDVFDVQGDKSLTAWTDSDGSYHSSALRPGTYKVRFKPGYYGGKGMVERWWKDQQTMAGSTPVVLQAKQQLTGIDATLGSVGNAVAPGAPTAVTATAGDGAVTVKWLAPASNGGLPITKYEVYGTPRSGCVTYGDLQCTIVVNNDQAYTFVVRASTDAGISPYSAASAAVTPVSAKPKAPTGVTATAGELSATVRWTPAAGPAATSYTVTSRPEGRTCSTASTSCVVTGLTGGQMYRFSVVAKNSFGDSPASVLSAMVTPTVPTGGGGGPVDPPAPPAPGGGSDPTQPPVTGSGGGGGGTTTPPPAAALGAKAKVKGKKVAVTWKPVPGATSYQVRVVKGKKASAWKTVSKPGLRTSQKKKGTYFVEIRAVGPGGQGPVKRIKFKIK